MKRNLFIFILVFLMVPMFSEVKLKRLNRNFITQYNRISSRLTPADRIRLAKVLNQFEEQMTPPERGMNHERALDRVFSACGLGNMHVMEAAFWIMKNAINDINDDIRRILAEIKAMTAAKQKLRDMIKELNEWISQEMGKGSSGEDIDNVEVSGSDPCRTIKIFARKNPRTPHYKVKYFKAPVINPVPHLDRLTLIRVKRLLNIKINKLKVMEQMNECLILKLKMLMDLRYRFIQTLSN